MLRVIKLFVADVSLLRQFFIYIHIHNAWDTSLCTDPFLGESRPDPKKYFIEYTRNQLLKNEYS